MVTLYSTRECLYDIDNRINIPFGIDEFNQILRESFEEIVMLNDSIAMIDTLLNRVDSVVKIAYSQFSNSRELDIEIKRQQVLKPYEHKLDSINSVIQTTKSADPINGESRLIINGVMVEHAQIRAEMANADFEYQDKVLSNYGAFGDRDLLYKYDSLYNKSNSLSNSILEMQYAIRDKQDAANDMTLEFHDHRLKLVGLLDFIYFSILAATSNNFGDIIPNSSLIRFFVCSQIIVSLVCVSFILDIFKR